LATAQNETAPSTPAGRPLPDIGKGEIVHEWLEMHGGAENVVESLMRIFPDTDVTCLWNSAPSRFPDRVKETWIAKTPLRKSKALAVPFMMEAWRNLPASEADWILCSSHLFAHHARFAGEARGARKLVYAYTPARYIWNPELDERAGSPLARMAAPLLRRVDQYRAAEAHSIVSISNFVRERISVAWDRDTQVIYPPVDSKLLIEGSSDVDRLSDAERVVLDGLPDQFVLGASRFVPYKRLDAVIDAGAAAGLPVVLAGNGPDRDRLIEHGRISGTPVTVIRSPSSGLLHELFRRALVYVFPAVEDFGIMPVEAMALGTGVVALQIGGASETVIDGETGALVASLDPHELRVGIEKASIVDPASCKARALSFDRSVFEAQIANWVSESGAR